jgi:beta-lactamase class A
MKGINHKYEKPTFIVVFRKYIITISAGLLVFWFGWWLNSYYYLHVEDRSKDILQIREDSGDYKFINPLLYVSDTRNIKSSEYAPLEKNVLNYISDAEKQGKAKDISFYFRDLNQAGWVGVNQEDLYNPGSMLKVSVLIAYFKIADEVDPNVLSDLAYYQPTDDPGQTYKPHRLLQPGYYTIKDLLVQMTTESDNDALHILNNLHIDEILKIYKDLRLPDPLKEDTELISPREYSRLFRVLYNVGYISNKYSEEALDILSRTTFKDGLVSGISSSTVMVSHKFGEYTNVTDQIIQYRELHDCGNVYYPGRPYFICVMTKGQDFPALAKIISDISKITFDHVANKL